MFDIIDFDDPALGHKLAAAMVALKRATMDELDKAINHDDDDARLRLSAFLEVMEIMAPEFHKMFLDIMVTGLDPYNAIKENS
jgi:hypothetical protein